MKKPEPQHRGLKIMVAALGLMLIGGTILLFAAVFQKMKHPEARKTRGQHCETAHVTLPEGAKLQSTLYEDREVILTYTTQDKHTVIGRYNLCDGAKLGELVVE